MEYVEPERARDLPGLRLALTTGVPGPWSEAAKSIFHVKKVDYIPVRQTAAEANEALVAWTGHRNAPQAIYDDEPPRIGWEEILMLAERLSSEPSLIPGNPRDRAFMLGLCHEIASEDGLAWNRRHQLLAPMLSSPEADTNPAMAGGRVLGSSYGWSPDAVDRSNERICQVLGLLSEQLARQKQAGREYFVGDTLSAVDIYWATFCALIRPLPADLNPMPDSIRAGYSAITPEVAAILDEDLIAHRDKVYERHLQLPLDF
jgi:glutathione S-transferase